MSRSRMTAATPKSRTTFSYWILLTLLSGSVALAPIAFVIVAFLSTGASTNAFDENGYGAALWLLLITVPTGIVIFAGGVLGRIALGLVRSMSRRVRR